jgi:ribosomal protein S18 acetylase RimI-like enzyme
MKIDETQIIENGHLEHFLFLPKKLGVSTYEVEGVTIINSQIESSMFNIAYGGLSHGAHIVDAVQRIKGMFGLHPFAWWIPPSQHDPNLTKILLKSNFILESAENAMICDLTNNISFKQKTNLIINQVKSHDQMQSFIYVLSVYDKVACKFYAKAKMEDINREEKLYVGYVKGAPVAIGILFVKSKVASIFCLIVLESERGKGYGTDVMNFLLDSAVKIGCKYATLSASSDAGFSVYKKLGFKEFGAFECFECKNSVAENL